MTASDTWEREFDKAFGNCILGVLSGDKSSPVFVNNEIEMPRLKSFIRATLKAQRIKDLEEIERLVGRLDKWAIHPIPIDESFWGLSEEEVKSLLTSRKAAIEEI